ncbi:NAD(P)H-dependent oxidoreductase [Kangiella aquimarina]|uniref:NAD(P)H-dependent oxidoreductase n=1 Tax=Kangiella aquimarina TaxID=261965 RepID=A0ABZ0X131_9GAMM|nr:NAD(P)H-dependent oxidoreductase [Kangiella aquimarina]WQG84099.1 NAD(P)H-dependent oxidoreductase [Kangiella aquimarina]
MQNKVLILFAHPAYEQSVANRAMVSAIRELEGVTFNDLYEKYPDFFIDVEEEQRLLKEHQIIIFQHPFYWYSSPSLLKEWQDVVLDYGFAYGDGGYQLSGKSLMNAVTIGGSESSYGSTGFNHYPVEELLKPFEQTAIFCGMRYLKPFVLFDALALSDSELADEAHRYAQLIRSLRDDDSLLSGENL